MPGNWGRLKLWACSENKDRRLGEHPQDEAWEGKEQSRKDEPAQKEPGVTFCLCRHSCSLGSKRPCNWKAQGREGGTECVALP